MEETGRTFTSQRQQLGALGRSSLGPLDMQMAAFSSSWAQKNPGEEREAKPSWGRTGEEKEQRMELEF